MMSASVNFYVNYPFHQFIFLEHSTIYLHILIQNLETVDRI
jgi:hypothetical protein